MAANGEETLAHLVADRAGAGRTYTFVALSERSIDPQSGYKPSANLLWKIAQGDSVKVNPALIRAVAAGLDLPLARVAEAATRQFIGYVVDDPFVADHGEDVVVRVAHRPGQTAGDLPRAKAFLDGVLKPDGSDG